ncbi:phospholipase A2 inhibitor and Ly6/PLAUR domain-containing protein-like [Xenopus tropicalis]|uniref:Phospholipase A2 inhibitor and Ly6/PLAUR domain-containing protein-like n=1 Tax=Xenopus tropicalis TaxID=8364 RepID=A0A8J1K1D1_XENTR|nr:phospholipase A2 inhibitor and Ly6/PLAUR domain-containing protein-like [Xenopus tropicalis]
MTRIDGKKCNEIIRYCLEPMKCGVNAYFSYTNHRGRQFLSCCDTDLCTPPQPTWTDSQTNGLTCPTCTSGSHDCMPNGSIACVGAESKCIKQTTIYRGPWTQQYIYTYRGCSSESVCSLGNWKEISEGSSTESVATCTDPEPGTANGSAGFPSIFALLAANCFVLGILDPIG